VTKQNPFEKLFKLWTEQTLQSIQDPELIRDMLEQFSKLQQEVFSIYDKEGQSSSNPFHNISSDLFNSIIGLTNRINELEARVKRLEEEQSKPRRKPKR
jgi:hypothetical protein